jgi:hypothetical protein
MFISAALDPNNSQILLGAHNGAIVEETMTIATGVFPSDVVVTALANGRFVVTWVDPDTERFPDLTYKIKAVIFEADGDRSAVWELISSTLEINKPVVAALPDGGFALAYERDGDVRAQVHNATGSMTASPTLFTAISPNVRRSLQLRFCPMGGSSLAGRTLDKEPHQVSAP